jgi:hypothetical protein
MRKTSFIPFFLFVSGLAIAFAAIFANALGLDERPGWGRVRIAVLIFSVLLVALSAFYLFYADKVNSAAQGVQALIERNPIVSRTRGNQNFIYLARIFKSYRFAFPFSILVVMVYVWLISSGAWVNWVSPTHYYADLARGFQKGNLFVPSKPEPGLLNLPDPYDPLARAQAGIKAPIDISYYNGKYYLYWGPVPSLLLVAVYPFYHGRVGDLQLVFAFVCGIFLIHFFLLIAIWDRFFNALPKWTLSVSILLVGLSGPVAFMLNNFFYARIYEAAIFGGQFFLMGGFAIALLFLNKPSFWKLALAGVLWALSIGTRQTLSLPIGFMALTLAYRILRDDKTFFQKFASAAILTTPIIVGFACLGWYNWARFGSVVESGLYYQINTGFVHYNADELIGFRYIPQNLYNYLLAPFGFAPQFPFLVPEIGNSEEVFFLRPLSPSIYKSQHITGLLYMVPFAMFAFAPSALLFLNPFKGKSTQTPIDGGERRVLSWIITTLSGSSLVAFGFLLTFFWAAMRYIEDFIPSLILLSVIGFWQGYALLLQKNIPSRLYAAFGFVLASASVVISVLLGVSMNDARFAFIRLFSFLQ